MSKDKQTLKLKGKRGPVLMYIYQYIIMADTH